MVGFIVSLLIGGGLVFVGFKVGYELGTSQEKPKKLPMPTVKYNAGNLLDPVTPADQREYAKSQKKG